MDLLEARVSPSMVELRSERSKLAARWFGKFTLPCKVRQPAVRVYMGCGADVAAQHYSRFADFTVRIHAPTTGKRDPLKTRCSQEIG